MLQFYFLSIMLNLVTGLILVFKSPEKADGEADHQPEEVYETPTFSLVLGILTFGTGFFKILTVIRGDIPVIGDLFPALAGLAGGFCLLYQYYRNKTAPEFRHHGAFEAIFVDGSKYIGIAVLLAALLHFLFPTVLFL